MSDAIVLDVADATPVRLDVGDADPIAREEIAELAERVTTVEGDVSGLSTRVGAVEGEISALGTTVDGIDARVEAIEADYVTAEDVMGALGGEAPALVAGSSRAMLGDAETASWTERTTAADGAALIEAICGNTVVQDGSLLPVRMEGVETVGFNLCPEVWQVGGLALATGAETSYTDARRTDFIPVFPSTDYYYKGTSAYGAVWYDAGKNFIDSSSNVLNRVRTTPAGARYVRLAGGSTIVDEQVCLNLSDPSRNGTYAPYWHSERAIPASTYFPDGMRSAGTVRDELTETQAITRVGSVDLGTLTWTAHKTNAGLYIGDGVVNGKVGTWSWEEPNNVTAVGYTSASTEEVVLHSSNDMTIVLSSDQGSRVWLRNNTVDDATALKASLNGVMLHYALATPTTTPIDPPLPMFYRTGAGGTERVMVASGTTSAPPVFATCYPLDPADLAASIAPVDGPTAKTNHQVGDLLMLGFTLCKATQVIVTGETIAIGTNVTRTTVAAELAALQ